MKNYKLHTSEGVRDFLGEELLVKKEIENRLYHLFESYGYNPVETPTFEYLDVYTSNGIQTPSLYNLINRQGELLALRNDMTSSIARIVATHDNNDILPKKYCYIADTFRYPRLYQGKSHVFTQAGIELIGISNVKADKECIKIAYNALNAINIKNFTIHIGSSSFIKTLFCDFGFNEEQILNLLTIIEAKNFVSLRNTLKEYNLSYDRINLVTKIMENAGKLNFLQGIIDELKGLNSALVLENLKTLYNELLKAGLQNKVVFDFSIYSYANYYTGVCFQVFADGIGKAIITGGRCDNLMSTFGPNLPAIGFGLNIDATMDYIIEHKLIVVNKERYVSFTDVYSHEYALEENNKLRSKGIVVDVSMFDTLDETIDYAKKINASKVLVYKNNKLSEIEVA